MGYRGRDAFLYELITNLCNAPDNQQGLNIFTLLNATMSLKKTKKTKQTNKQTNENQ